MEINDNMFFLYYTLNACPGHFFACDLILPPSFLMSNMGS